MAASSRHLDTTTTVSAHLASPPTPQAPALVYLRYYPALSAATNDNNGNDDDDDDDDDGKEDEDVAIS